MAAAPSAETAPVRRRVGSLEVLCVLLLVALIGQSWLRDALDVPMLQTASTVFVAICVQALPFLVLGVLLSGAITAFVPAKTLDKLLPKQTGAGVGVAAVAGVGLPTCECSAVPVAKRLMGRGVKPAVALTFMNAAPAVNPVVLVATAVAFPAEPGMVWARLVASLATAMLLGWLWQALGRTEWIAARARKRTPDVESGNKWRTFAETARADLVDAGGFLVLGGLIAAAMNVLVPRDWFGGLGDQVVVAIVVLALLAVLLSLCSEADAFVVASIPGVPLVAKLAFLVVGPVVDLKLVSMYSGTFGRAFAIRFAPVAFLVAVVCASFAGAVLLS